MDIEQLKKRVAALEVEVQELRISRKETLLVYLLALAIADLILNPLTNLVIGLLQK